MMHADCPDSVHSLGTGFLSIIPPDTDRIKNHLALVSYFQSSIDRVMSQVRRQADEIITPTSLKGMWRSIAAAFEQRRVSPLQPVSAMLSVAVLIRFCYASILAQGTHGSCVSAHALRDPLPLMLSFITPDSFMRMMGLLALLAINGIAIEQQIGSLRLGLILGASLIVLSAVFSQLLPTLCFPASESLGPILVISTLLIHANNSRVFSGALPASVRVPFDIELRWHAWVILIIYTMTTDLDTLRVYGVALVVGACPCISSIVSYVKAAMVSGSAKKWDLILAFLVATSVAVLPFSVRSLSDLPFNGPTLLNNRGAVIRDPISLIACHLLIVSPIFILLDSSQRLKPMMVPIVFAMWVYCSQSPLFSNPGPALLVLGYVAYVCLVGRD